MIYFWGHFGIMYRGLENSPRGLIQSIRDHTLGLCRDGGVCRFESSVPKFGTGVGGRGGGGRARAVPDEGGRRVVTERDVEAIAAAGQSLSRGPGCVITPAAIDRAKAFGIWRE